MSRNQREQERRTAMANSPQAHPTGEVVPMAPAPLDATIAAPPEGGDATTDQAAPVPNDDGAMTTINTTDAEGLFVALVDACLRLTVAGKNMHDANARYEVAVTVLANAERDVEQARARLYRAALLEASRG